MSTDRRTGRGFQRPAWLSERGLTWLLRAAPVMLLLMIFAIKSLSMVGVNSAGMRAYEKANFGSSRTSFAQLGFLNILEPWIATYNRGTAEYQLRDYDAARESFTKALDQAPKKYDCRVRLNLAASIEGQADVLAGQQQHAKAAERYEEGVRIQSEGECGEPPEGEPSPDPSASEEPSESPSGEPSESPSGEPTPSDGPSGEPSDDPSGEPTDGPSGEPTDGPSGEPTDGPSGEPTEGPGEQGGEEGQDGKQSEEERHREEAKRKQEQQERMEKKAEEQRTQAERTDEGSDEGEDDPEPPPDEAGPEGGEQRQKQLEERSKKAQGEQQKGRDREGAPDQRSDKPW
ncbi:tetratricopeptide repeat protein [Enemella sp. A6]|uniref:tetratricopeptide repeat protein n=1 Tax=Enemella sp. A6 TaxID=3440152 RepID=UPI003EBF8E79